MGGGDFNVKHFLDPLGVTIGKGQGGGAKEFLGSGQHLYARQGHAGRHALSDRSDPDAPGLARLIGDHQRAVESSPGSVEPKRYFRDCVRRSHRWMDADLLAGRYGLVAERVNWSDQDGLSHG